MDKCINKICGGLEDCNNYNKQPELCALYLNSAMEKANKKLRFMNEINVLYRNIDAIEDFLEKYDEEVGINNVPGACDYDEAIAVLRNTLHQIVKETS